MSLLLAHLRKRSLVKASSARAGDVAAEFYRDKDPKFQDELGDLVSAVTEKRVTDVPKELGEAALAGQVALAQSTGTNLPLVAVGNSLAGKRRRKSAWQRELSRYRLPFSEHYFRSGSNFGNPAEVKAAFLAAGKVIDDQEALQISMRMTQQHGDPSREKSASVPHIAKMQEIIRRAAEIGKALGPDARDRHTMEHLGSVFGVAKKRLRNQLSAAPQTSPAVAPPAVVASPSASAPMRQAEFSFLKQSSLSAHLRRARNRTHTHPTPAQAAAGNYAKGSLVLHGMHVKLENPKGTERRGYDKDGNITWRRTMSADYGYFVGTKAIDGDAVDCFIGEHPDSNFVVAIDQEKRDGSFDETKFVLGCTNQEQAEKLYLSHYQRGWRLGPVSTTTVQQLKEWLKNGDTKSPFKGQLVKAAFVKQDADTGKWILWTKDKKRKLGTHDTPEEAYAQEYAIQKSQERSKSAAEECKPYDQRLRNLRLRRGECPVCAKPNQDPYPPCGCEPDEEPRSREKAAKSRYGDPDFEARGRLENEAFERAVEKMPEGSDKEMAKKGHGTAKGSCGCRIRGCRCPSRMHNISLTLDIPCEDCAAKTSPSDQ
jgi:hypothetical protein